MRRFLSAALLLIAAPALAQTADAPPDDAANPVDEAVVGTWELAEVEDGGLMEELGAEIDALVLRVEADGDALVTLEVTQDQETLTRQDAFQCAARDGQIVAENRPTIAYEVIGEDEIRLMDPEGVVLRMKRADAEDLASLE